MIKEPSEGDCKEEVVLDQQRTNLDFEMKYNKIAFGIDIFLLLNRLILYFCV